MTIILVVIFLYTNFVNDYRKRGGLNDNTAGKFWTKRTRGTNKADF